ncbi:MAG: hypothetical protein ACPGSD_00180 [Flavobacteriales bacterium]
MRPDKPFDSKAERRIGYKYSKEIERNIKTNANSRFSNKSRELNSITVKPRIRQKRLKYIAIEAPKHAFVLNFGTNRNNKPKKEQVKGFARRRKQTKQSRFRKGYQTVKPFSRIRKRNIKANRFITDAITDKAINGLANEITELRADEVLTRVFN